MESLAPSDVVIVGATTGAVAAALECRARGLSVRVISDLSHLSEDGAGRLNLWGEKLDRSDPVVAAIHPQPKREATFPAAMKRAAEALLIEAGIPFLYEVRPVAVMRDSSGTIGGLLLAARSAVFAVRCATVIDASRFGVVARLAGVTLTPRPERQPRLHWNVLATQKPAWTGEAHPIDGTIDLPHDETAQALQAWRLDVTPLSGRPEAFGHELHAALLDPNVRLSAEIPPQHPAETCGEGALVSEVSSLADTAFTAAPGLMMMNGLLPLDATGLEKLDQADVQAALGRAAAQRAPMKKVEDGIALGVDAGSGLSDDRVTPAFLRQSGNRIEIPVPAFPVIERLDVVVGGGGTGGAPAGIGAARAGARTVVLESQGGLGGVGTLGLIACYYFGNRVGFTAELDQLIEKIDVDRKNRSKWNPELKLAAYHRLLRDAGGEAWMRSFAFGTRQEGDRITGVLVSTPWGSGVLEAGCVVDATGNADLAAAAGAPCRWIGADHVAVQGTGLSPRNPLVDYRNTDHTFIDDTDPEGITHAHVNARAKFDGEFDTSPLVDSRERRQIVGDMELSPLDILAGRTFPDTLVTAASNFDTHGFTVHPVFFLVPPDKKPLQAHVPFRAMLPQKVDGLIVTGLGTSAHRDSLPVIRMQADVQNQGFAAGWAAATSAHDRRPLRELDVRALQTELVRIGNLDESILTHGDSFPLSPETVQAAAEAGPTNFANAAVLFAHLDEARPALREKCREGSLDAALLLGLMGDGTGLDALLTACRNQPWDDGWNYRGMGQFGMSSSRMDAIVIAIGRIGNEAGIETIEEKIGQLQPDAAFSHCRSVAIAAACLRGDRLSKALLRVLRFPGMTGHAQTDTARIIRDANTNPTETEARNLSLRELYLARGLYLSGDVDNIGRRLLETYMQDLRGHFARHARAVLESTPAAADKLAWA